MRLRRRLALVASTYLALMAIGGASALVAATVRADRSATGRAFIVGLEEVNRLRIAYLDMETGERGFVVTRDTVLLEPYEAGRTSAGQLQGSLESVTRRDPVLRVDLENVVTTGGTWLGQSAGPAVEARRGPLGSVPSAAAVARGKALFDQVRAALDHLESDLGHGVDAADRGRERAARVMTILLVVAPLVGIAVTIVASWLINRWVIHPLDAMIDSLRQVRSGDPAATVPALGAPDVADLGHSIDDMRRTISRQLDEAVRARESVEQNAVLALRVRHELAGDVAHLPAGWTCAASLLPAQGLVAGDCYDMTLISPTRLAVFVLDIAGHGGAPAVVALKCKEILAASLRTGMDPGRAIAQLAGQVGDLEDSFLTAFVAIIDMESGECRFANAGHPPAMLAALGAVEELMPTGPLIGPFPGTWRTDHRLVQSGGNLAVYTDGLVEARDRNGAFYGTEQLAAMVVSVPCGQAEPLIEACFSDLRRFSPERLIDDVTMVMVCRDCLAEDV